MQSEGRPVRPRLHALDIARGVALLAMVVYHLFWDLGYFGFYPVDVTQDPPWVAFQRLILSSFMILVGVGLVLGHGNGIRWRAFWRRFAMIAGAALLVTAGTFWLFPETFVYFGVLHAIALFSLMGLPFLFAPAWLSAGLGIAIITAAAFIRDPVFTERIWSWIGFWPVSPPVNDLVPVFPWFGVVLLGLSGSMMFRESGIFVRMAGWPAPGPIGRAFAFAGRWSLLIYLLHQPLLLGLLTPMAQWVSNDAGQRAASFVQSCEVSCLGTGGQNRYCVAYCGCALEQVEGANLWDAIENQIRPPAQQAEIDSMVALCSAMAAP
jgi:uncharacterized membrane protein